MKKFLLPVAALAMIFALGSCKKCYDCTTTYAYDYEDDFWSSTGSFTEEKCDRKNAIDDYEAENTTSDSGSDVFGNYDYSETTVCEEQ